MATPPSIPTLHGDGITLRPHRGSDVEAVLERCQDPESQRFTTVPLDYTRAMAEEYVEQVSTARAGETSWAIEKHGAYAGTIDLRRLASGAGSLGFVTHPAWRGQGVMTEAVRVVLDHAFDTLAWDLVQWQAHAGNWASAKSVWRNGFPTPLFVPALLVERDTVVDGWISTVRRGAPRVPSTGWHEVVTALSD